VQKIQCARVYHINVVLRIRTSVQDTRKDKAYKEKSLQIQRSERNLPILPRIYCAMLLFGQAVPTRMLRVVCFLWVSEQHLCSANSDV